VEDLIIKNVTPLRDTVVLIRHKIENIGKIILPDGNGGPRDYYRYEVAAVGPDVEHVAVGDFVVVSSRAPVSALTDNHSIQLCQESGILSKIEYNV
jgi:co-chaperonin GroES (HSP10)